MRSIKKKLSMLLALMMPLPILAGCTGTPEGTSPSKETVPADYQWATYYSAEDAPFLPKDIFTQEMYVPGFATGAAQCGRVERTDREDTGAFVLKGEFSILCIDFSKPFSLSYTAKPALLVPRWE